MGLEDLVLDICRMGLFLSAFFGFCVWLSLLESMPAHTVHDRRDRIWDTAFGDDELRD